MANYAVIVHNPRNDLHMVIMCSAWSHVEFQIRSWGPLYDITVTEI